MASPLVPQRNSFMFIGGQEQSASPELFDSPKLVKAHNVFFNRQGELMKRRGWHAQAEEVHGYDYLPIPDRVAARGNEALWIGETRDGYYADHLPVSLIARAQAESDNEFTPVHWVTKGHIGRFSSQKILEFSHSQSGLPPIMWDCAFAGNSEVLYGNTDGVVCCVWATLETSVSVRIEYAVIDIRTRSILHQEVLATTALIGTICRVIGVRHSSGSWYFHIFYVDDQVSYLYGNVYRVYVNAGAPWSHSSPYLMATDATNFDVCVNDDDDTIAPEKRVFIVKSTYGASELNASMYVPEGSGTLTYTSGDTMTIDSVTSAVPVYWSLQCACDPVGLSVAAHLSVLASGCVGTPSNVYGLWHVAAYPSSTFTEIDNIVTASGADATSDGRAGCQIGWAGVFSLSSTDRYDNYWLTWERDDGETQGLLALLMQAMAAAPLSPETPRLATSSIRPFGRPWYHNGQTYVPTVRGVIADACVVEFVGPYRAGWTGGDPATNYRVYGRILGGEIANGADGALQDYPMCRGRNSVVQSWHQRGRFYTVYPTVSVSGQEYNLALMDLDTREPERFGWGTLDLCTVFAGSMPWVYDGGQGHEMGFPCRPQSDLGEITVLNVTDTPSMTAGTYRVAACWESVDSMGRITRSAPSFGGSVTIGAGEVIQVTYTPLCVTSHPECRLVVYVSDSAGVNYYRSMQVIENTWYPTGDVSVNLTPAMLFRDGVPTLYTNSGILANVPPPSIRFTCVWQNRVWGANGSTIWYTRETVNGEEFAFNDALSFQVRSDVTGIIGFDDRLLIFAIDGIYWISGDGPTDTGTGGTFTPPQRLPTQFGCVTANSLCRVDNGIVFQSSRGIEFIDQSLSPRVISGGIAERFTGNAKRLRVLAASWDPEYQICRFVTWDDSAANTERAIALWHSQFDEWTTQSNPTVTLTPSRSLVVGDIVRILDGNWMAVYDDLEGAYYEDPSCYLMRERRPGEWATYLYTDGIQNYGVGYQIHVETANLKLDSLLGFTRVWRIYVFGRDNNSYAGYELSYAHDYRLQASSTRQWDTDEAVDACYTDSPHHLMFGIHVKYQQSKAMRIIIKDIPRDPTYESYAFVLLGFGIEWGQMPGTGRGREKAKK